MSETRAADEQALTEIARRISVSAARLNGIGKSIWWLDRVPPPFSYAMNVLVGLPLTALMAARLRGLPGSSGTELLYRKATGAGRDAAQADVAAVEARLRRLTLMNEDPTFDDAAVEQMSLILIRWVAGGRPLDDAVMARAEQAFQRVVKDADRSGGKPWRRSRDNRPREHRRQYVEACKDLLGGEPT